MPYARYDNNTAKHTTHGNNNTHQHDNNDVPRLTGAAAFLTGTSSVAGAFSLVVSLSSPALELFCFSTLSSASSAESVSELDELTRD